MFVHFVCRGNAFRSRLAEAYCNSRKVPNISATSSGVEQKVTEHENGPISWYAARILAHQHLIPFMSYLPTQTTKKLLEDADVVVFLGKRPYGYYEKNFKTQLKQSEVWDILDLDDAGFTDEDQSAAEEIRRIEYSEKVFSQIKVKVDELFQKLSK